MDLADAARDATELGVHANLHRVLQEWRTTARLLAGPELAGQAMAPLPDEDHGEVPGP
ncbi:hypothetical protein V1J52_15610 [Streptomyces sp. TRM 70351]|uniref:hypothetical protein n=1 Tax=Streptomyces sp. TRM 70351 TaxID=3116552 RepID=UPI002E7BA7A7|nr:hypothetical protein [Streptomyces sp. TRM 70351]MEE1929595.1 hypothetical protein [Streptomyces sp. TRM 70351]